MRLVYTYEGERDPSFEDAMQGVVQDYGQARQLSSVATANGVNAVTIEIDLEREQPADGLAESLVRRLRAHERVVDVAPEGAGRLY